MFALPDLVKILGVVFSAVNINKIPGTDALGRNGGWCVFVLLLQ